MLMNLPSFDFLPITAALHYGYVMCSLSFSFVNSAGTNNTVGVGCTVVFGHVDPHTSCTFISPSWRVAVDRASLSSSLQVTSDCSWLLRYCTSLSSRRTTASRAARSAEDSVSAARASARLSALDCVYFVTEDRQLVGRSQARKGEGGGGPIQEHVKSERRKRRA